MTESPLIGEFKEGHSLQTSNSKTENHRFYLAVLIVSSLVIVIFIPTFFRDYSSSKELAAIFSGWITAIVGFYFLQQNTERAQEELKNMIAEAKRAKEETTNALKKTNELSLALESTISQYKRLFHEVVDRTNKKLSELEKMEES